MLSTGYARDWNVTFKGKAYNVPWSYKKFKKLAVIQVF